MIDIDEDLGSDQCCALLGFGKVRLVNQQLCARGDCFVSFLPIAMLRTGKLTGVLDLLPNSGCRRHTDHGTDTGLGFTRVAELVLFRHVCKQLDEFVVL